MNTGFIGLGHMGGPMCANLLAAGHAVTVHDLDPEAVAARTGDGAVAASTPADVAADSAVVFTSLPMPADVEAVALGASGIAEGAAPGTIVVDLSTNSPVVVRRIAERLAERQVVLLDAPVSGGVVGAAKASLAIMVGGDRDAFDTVLPLLEAMGKTISHLGDNGCGCIAKIVNNLMAFCNMAAAAEGLMLGAAAGIDPSALNEVIRNSSGNSMGYRGMAHTTLRGDWSPSFALDLAYKDMHLALELADELGVPLPLSAQTHNLMRMARGMGLGGDDATAMMRVYETTLGREVRG